VITVFVIIKYYQNKKLKNKSTLYVAPFDQQHNEHLLSDNLFAASNQKQSNDQNNMKTPNDTSLPLDMHQQASCMSEKQIKSDQVCLIEQISHGHLSNVWKGRLKENVDSDRLMAVKIFPIHEKQSWQNEKEIYSYLESEFILK
jgi:hypothetical protein